MGESGVNRTGPRKVAPGQAGATVAKRNPKYGEDALADIETVKVALDNGKVVPFRLADELVIPSGQLALVQADRRAPARLAFWRYQWAKAASRARSLEREYDYVVAEIDILQRAANVDAGGDYTERLVKSQVDITKDVVQKRKELERALETRDVLKGVADAMEHRCYSIRRLLAQTDTKE